MSVAYITTISELKGKFIITWSILFYNKQQTPKSKWCTVTIWMYCLNRKWIKHRSNLGCNRLHSLEMMIYMICMCVCMLYCNFLGGLEDILASLLFRMCVYIMCRINTPRVFCFSLYFLQHGNLVLSFFSFSSWILQHPLLMNTKYAL